MTKEKGRTEMKKIIKSIAVVFLAVMMCFSFTGCGSRADGVIEEGTLHLATNAAFPPYEMTDKNGDYQGIDIEIARAIAEKLDLKLVVDDMDFASVITSVKNRKADIVMAGLTVNEERKKDVDFTVSYAKGIQVVIVPENSDISSIEDLANDKMIGTQKETTGNIYCSDVPANGGYGEEHVVAYANGEAAVQALLEGKIDAVVIDNGPAQEFVKANKRLKILESKFVEEEYAIGVAKGNRTLLEAVNTALKELIADGTVQKIIDKYIV